MKSKISRDPEDSIISQFVDQGIEAIGRYYSIYRAVVVDIEDELEMDRLKVYVPSVGIIDWALPKGNHGSHNCGVRQHPLPKVQDLVYVTFENGNPALPLWEWHPWAERQRPNEFDDPDVCGIITPKGTKVLINDRTGDIIINAKSRVAIHAEGEDGVIIAGNKIYLNSGDQVVVNHGDQGIPNIVQLTEKLNQLVQEIDQLRTSFNSHTHPGITPGSMDSSPTLSIVAKPVTQFNKEDYEDISFLH